VLNINLSVHSISHRNFSMLAEVAVAVFCLKAVRYCMYMWLPMYLLNQVLQLRLKL